MLNYVKLAIIPTVIIHESMIIIKMSLRGYRKEITTITGDTPPDLSNTVTCMYTEVGYKCPSTGSHICFAKYDLCVTNLLPNRSSGK